MAEPEPPLGEPEGEGPPEPEVERPNPVPENSWQDTPWPEAEPDWPRAFEQWKVAWHLHVYIVGAIFMIIAILTMFSICTFLFGRQSFRHGRLTFSLQCMLLFFSLLRCMSMFMDPYHTNLNVNTVASNVVWSISLPALTASFSVLLLVFLDTTRMTLGPPLFQKLSVIMTFTAGHFSIVIVSYVAYLLDADLKSLLLMCQLLFIMYGLLLGVGYLYSAIVIYNKCKAGAINVEENIKIYRIVKLACIASVIAFAIAVTHLYAASSEFGIYSDVMHVDAWDWWIYQTIVRLEELVSCMVVLAIAFRNPLREDNAVILWCKKYKHRRILHTDNATLTTKALPSNSANATLDREEQTRIHM